MVALAVVVGVVMVVLIIIPLEAQVTAAGCLVR
jgi:hypothetical protein